MGLGIITPFNSKKLSVIEINKKVEKTTRSRQYFFLISCGASIKATIIKIIIIKTDN